VEKGGEDRRIDEKPDAADDGEGHETSSLPHLPVNAIRTDHTDDRARSCCHRFAAIGRIREPAVWNAYPYPWLLSIASKPPRVRNGFTLAAAGNGDRTFFRPQRQGTRV
jgi:hypothetical protein